MRTYGRGPRNWAIDISPKIEYDVIMLKEIKSAVPSGSAIALMRRVKDIRRAADNPTFLKIGEMGDERTVTKTVQVSDLGEREVTFREYDLQVKFDEKVAEKLPPRWRKTLDNFFDLQQVWPLQVWLEVAIGAIRGTGWIKSHGTDPKSANQFCTWRQVSNFLNLGKEKAGGEVVFSPEDREEVATIIAAASKLLDLPNSEQTRYTKSIGEIARSGWVCGMDQFGIAASMVRWYRTKMERERKMMQANNFLGAPGEKLTADVRMTGQRMVATRFGNRVLVKLEDRTGNIINWWASVTNDRSFLKEDDFVPMAFTVKKHDSWNGLKQTVVSRCKAG